ncbi:MAG: 2-succinyl-5-enolpyruvyl-6-hydroxy-3-cyclohexene-1-carboxylic-acid synthase [Cytophagales bacterium]|nr:MAG: 2-succinyl-5-enolpyruvyl-6-hydroxy-3-cyclohexene-1-carboxylic-acid synthase [Cytophagales bacterium]TAF60252.1 MAG: 2-succinyl-5-enolpyruvyl-6-hydroxy-3-cyclohexene-1-carboxylic-acid synthase [Cytophagales bacterium]
MHNKTLEGWCKSQKLCAILRSHRFSEIVMPSSLIHFPALHWASLCAASGIQDVILSPGSRSAPLSLAFARTSGIRCTVIADERVAGFVALGMAEQTQKPVIVVCTSGSALLNLAPAVSEAHFRQIPLLILSADRPPELIGQQDGQTIFQENALGKHTKAFFQLPTRTNETVEFRHSLRIFQEAMLLLHEHPRGVVHINCPFREPFYPDAQEINIQTSLQPWARFEASDISTGHFQNRFLAALPQHPRVLIVAGQGTPPQGLWLPPQVPLVADIISNCQHFAQSIKHHDLFLSASSSLQPLRPNVLITFGQSVVSKNLKQFLRSAPINTHWHIQAHGDVPDTFHSLTHLARMPLDEFWQNVPAFEENKAFYEAWHMANQAVADIQMSSFEQEWTEFTAIAHTLAQLPDQSCLHLANSMAVRYANFLGLSSKQKQVIVYANRGTSGIDGCLSTAIGQAKANSERLHFLLVGDTAFFYDLNAFWQDNLPKNLRILLNNNQGGGIFQFLPDARKQRELEKFFVVPHTRQAHGVAAEYGLSYQSAKSLFELKHALPTFLAPHSGLQILECFSERDRNLAFFEQHKALIAQKMRSLA